VHSYSAAGQLTGLSWNSTPIISSLTWTAAGQPAGWTWPFATSGISGGVNINATRSYDTAGRVTATEQSGYSPRGGLGIRGVGILGGLDLAIDAIQILKTEQQCKKDPCSCDERCM